MMQSKEFFSSTDRIAFDAGRKEIHVLILRGVVSYVDIARMGQLIHEGLTSADKDTVLVVDCSELMSIEPGVTGRLLAGFSAGSRHYRRWVIVTRNRTIVSLARAAMTMFKGVAGQFAGTLSEGLDLANAMVSVAKKTAETRGGKSRARAESAEILKPGILAAETDDETGNRNSA